MQKLDGCIINDVKLRLKENIHDTTDKELLCLELDASQINDTTESLMKKILKYVFDDEKVRIEKIEEYSRWWSLGSALWIQTCGQINSAPILLRSRS